jgi:hypothetical protein
MIRRGERGRLLSLDGQKVIALCLERHAVATATVVSHAMADFWAELAAIELIATALQRGGPLQTSLGRARAERTEDASLLERAMPLKGHTRDLYAKLDYHIDASDLDREIDDLRAVKSQYNEAEETPAQDWSGTSAAQSGPGDVFATGKAVMTPPYSCV